VTPASAQPRQVAGIHQPARNFRRSVSHCAVPISAPKIVDVTPVATASMRAASAAEVTTSK
jgi:hypothetical protein